MKILLDAFWRAVAYCLRPRVILLSLLPFVVMLLAGLAFAQWGWWPAVDTVLEWLEGTTLLATLHQALDWLNLPQFKNVIAPLVIWQIKKDTMPFASEQAKESLNFQITVLIAASISAILIVILVGIFLLFAVGIAAIILTIIAGVKANEGVAYRYPFTLRLVN